ncbi:hypothetical protein B0H14DRAFT_2586038 [Mycena olivaceomarginata]|nr:hypothetical protein B0H14DRAFT_2586038 [Mycena olivaceomarginata]
MQKWTNDTDQNSACKSGEHQSWMLVDLQYFLPLERAQKGLPLGSSSSRELGWGVYRARLGRAGGGGFLFVSEAEQHACGRIPKRRLRWRVSVGPGNVTDPGSVRAPNARFASGPCECEHREIRTKAPTPNSTAVVPNICIGKGEDHKGEIREAGKYGQCKTCHFPPILCLKRWCALAQKITPTWWTPRVRTESNAEKRGPGSFFNPLPVADSPPRPKKKYCGPPSTIRPDPPAMAGPLVAASSRLPNLALEASLLSEEREEERCHQQRLRNRALMDTHR